MYDKRRIQTLQKSPEMQWLQTETTGLLTQNIFKEQLGQIREEIGRPKTIVEEERSSMKEMEREWSADSTPNFERE